jgi:hypothetical protein
MWMFAGIRYSIEFRLKKRRFFKLYLTNFLLLHIMSSQGCVCFRKLSSKKEKIMNYRRLIFAGMAAVLICSFAPAQEGEGIGLTPKLEVGFGNVADEAEISLSPGVEYEKSFGDLDVFAEADYTIAIPSEDGMDTFHVLYLEEEVGYNLGLGDAMTLSVILNNKNNILVSPDAPSGTNPFDGVLEPSVKFAYAAGFGEVSAQAGFPIGYAAPNDSLLGTSADDGDTAIDAYLTLAWASTFGLGVELTPNLALSPDSEYAGFDILINYENGPIYAEVEVNLPKEIDVGGVTITPEFDYAFKGFTFYVKSEFGGIGVEDGDVSVSPALGAKYSF